MQAVRLAAILGCAASVACAHTIARPRVSPAKPAGEALLVLPGFGYGSAGERAFRSLAPAMAADGVDLFVPTYLSRSGLDTSRVRLQHFIRENRLERYERVHVFAFIAGGWTFNALDARDTLPNLSTIIYDRSPYQERAPLIARDRLRWLTRLNYGSVVFDVARTPYPPLAQPAVRVGLVVETVPTSFIRRFAATARRYGPYRFECDAFGQRYDDCAFVALSHDQIYSRFAEVWPDVRSFIREGRFGVSANRTPPPAPMRTVPED
jgi:hypothetical protein